MPTQAHRRALWIPLLATFLLGSGSAPASGERIPSFGPELRAYPAGFAATLQMEKPVSDRWQWSLGGGWNFTDRRDWGEHDDESGGGPGLGVRLQRSQAWGERRWMAGLRADLWFLDVDWEDGADGSTPAATGRSEIVVLQPTAHVALRVGSLGGWTADVSLAVGQEINLRTRGQEVGEGPIALLGLALLR